MKVKTHFESCINKGRGYSFSLFPILTFDKTIFVSGTEFDLLFGIWFWYLEISWSKFKY